MSLALNVANARDRRVDIQLFDFVGTFDPANEWEEVHHEINDTGRWESYETIVFKLPDGSHLAVDHSEGLTEYQESTGVTDAYQVVEKLVVKRTFERIK